MKWRKSPDALVQAFDHCLPIAAGVQRKAMFGYPCAFVNGHLFCGLHLDSIIVRLPEGRRNALVARGASVFMPMPGRAMKEYVLAPADIVADREKLRALLGEALAHASSLAPKVKKPSGAKKKVATPKRKATPARKAPPAKKLPAKKGATKMATKKTGERKYGKGASAKVAKAMHERKEGTLRSGSSGKRVTSRKQAIAIGLSEARRAGKKVPKKKGSSKKG